MRRSLLFAFTLSLALLLAGCAQGFNPSTLFQSSAPTSTPTTAASHPTSVSVQATSTPAPAAPASAAASEGIAALRAQQQALEELYARIRPSVVQIIVSGSAAQPNAQVPSPFGNLPGLEQPQQRFQQSGQGSGFVYDSAGHIVTNNHVVENADQIEVRFSDDSAAVARVVGRDPYADLAVIKVDSLPQDVKPLQLGPASELRVGQTVIALGNPFGLPGSMTTGIISGLERNLPTSTTQFRLPDVIQTDAAINPGNSGGPLLDLDGRVIGVNTAIESPSGAFAGIGFAVPADQVQRVIPTLIADGSYHYPWMGVELLDLTPSVARAMNLVGKSGALIGGVTSGGPAERAGLQGGTDQQIDGGQVPVGGDVVIAIDGTTVASGDDLVRGILNHKVGDTVELTVLHDGQEQRISVTLGERPTQPTQ